ncbi:leucine-rich repeat-containing protein 70-like [Saccostrea cucullata]|uniref:leucine-rich repeat-containing protein 70-like n=1 Tax=Saccostrea cuccullata TaxID=36930 RepID=UPI002ED43219
MQSLIILSLVLVFKSCLGQSCPAPANSGCTCDEGPPGSSERVINCRDAGLSSIPVFSPSDEVFLEVTFSNTQSPSPSCSRCNKITTVPANAFQGLKFKVLDLSKNSVSSFDNNAFAGLEDYMEELTIQGSSSAVPYTAISRLRKLKKLSLSHFSQSIIGRDNTDLQSLVNLETLEFKNMDTEFIQSDAFKDRVPMLKKLVLEALKIRTFPVAGIAELTSLEHLSAVYLEIKEIPYQALASLHNLQELVLSHNGLTTLRSGCFDGIQDSLRYLGLHINNLDESSVGAIASERWDKLEQLNLGHNNMKVIPSGLFYNMRSLVYLNIDSNWLTKIGSEDFQGLDSLQFLDASYNNLVEIEDGAFMKTPRLQELDLRGENTNIPQNTAIFQLNTKSVQGLDNLERLILADTVLDETTLWSALKRLTNLQVLKLGGTGITEIPDFQFENNQHLKYLMVENNKLTKLTEQQMYGLTDNLVSLSIGNNQIRELDECALNKFTKLEMLYINNLPLHCDCKILWLYDWLNELRIKNDIKYFLIRAICSTPTPLAGRNLVTVNRTKLVCESSYTPKRCNDFTTPPSITTTVSPSVPPVTKKSPTNNVFSFERITESSSTVKFEWKVSDPEKIDKYFLEYQLLRTFQWNKVDVPRTALSFEKENLQKNSNYLFCLTVVLKSKESIRPCIVVNTLP